MLSFRTRARERERERGVGGGVVESDTWGKSRSGFWIMILMYLFTQLIQLLLRGSPDQLLGRAGGMEGEREAGIMYAETD